MTVSSLTARDSGILSNEPGNNIDVEIGAGRLCGLRQSTTTASTSRKLSDDGRPRELCCSSDQSVFKERNDLNGWQSTYGGSEVV
ncbi:hypothetical protein CCHR01_16330 [Colletotrichum chrysophilum]|uniref:Uncharacterized protein n=1 Tax=Colletotrichum chrysophilum TaxID=1836956 RepID=A0AAD9A8P3_9PEZI|nr:hypothetical protein CCHR01_16330 [Colletotrichum chrysophilum]